MKIDPKPAPAAGEQIAPSQVAATETMMALREKAEAIFRAQSALAPKQAEAVAAETTLRALRELRLHQIELEMQNDELRRSRDALDSSRSRYFDLYDLAPVGYCTLSESGIILQANLLASSFLGVSRGALVGKPFSRFLFKEYADRYHLHRRQLLETEAPQAFELRMVSAEGKPFWVQLAATVGQEEDGATVLRVVLNDIDQRKQAEAALQKSEAFNSAILDSLGAEIAVVDRDGKIVAVNQSWRRLASKYLDQPGRHVSAIAVGANSQGAARLTR